MNAADKTQQSSTIFHLLPNPFHSQIQPRVQGNLSTISPQDGKRRNVSNSSWISETPKAASWEPLKGLTQSHRLSANGVHASAARACEQAQSSQCWITINPIRRQVCLPWREKWELTPHSSNHSEDTLFTSGDLITFSSTFLSYLGAKCLVILKHQTFPLINLLLGFLNSTWATNLT